MKDFAISFLVTVAAGLLAVMWREHRAPEVVVDRPLPVARAAARGPVVPWVLTTRCTVDSRNLPIREPEVKT